MNQITKSRRHPPEAVEVGVEAEMIWTAISMTLSPKSLIMVADHIVIVIMITTRESMSTVTMRAHANDREFVNARENTMIIVTEIVIEIVTMIATVIENVANAVIAIVTETAIEMIAEIGIMMTDHETDPEEIVRAPMLT